MTVMSMFFFVSDFRRRKKKDLKPSNLLDDTRLISPDRIENSSIIASHPVKRSTYGSNVRLRIRFPEEKEKKKKKNQKKE